ncbi:hypothetical protein [Leminorella grimontii]|uniref:hypothetical protein n=1 Tax=Leminorella grimontii TaxID=82981 RepID=UPI003220520E
MYNKFNECILDFSLERDPGDYWYDCAILESTDILKKFDKKDWKVLLEQLGSKPLFWQKRLVECLGDLHSPYEIEVILYLIDTDDEDLFITCIDSLRLLDLSGLSGGRKEEILSKVTCLLDNKPLPVKKVIEELIRKINKPNSY